MDINIAYFFLIVNCYWAIIYFPECEYKWNFNILKPMPVLSLMSAFSAGVIFAEIVKSIL